VKPYGFTYMDPNRFSLVAHLRHKPPLRGVTFLDGVGRGVVCWLKSLLGRVSMVLYVRYGTSERHPLREGECTDYEVAFPQSSRGLKGIVIV